MKKFVLLTVVFLVSGIFVSAQTGGLKGKIRTSKGDGIANVVVTARRDGKEVKTAKSDGKGNFTIQGLEAGDYNLIFDGKGYSSALLQNVEVKKDKIRELPDRLVLAVDQGTLVIINGSVFNQDGRSITGAEVFIEKLNSDGSAKKLGSLYTSVRGEFTFRQPEGTAKYRLTAKFKDLKASKELDVDGAAIYRLAITLNIEKDQP